MSRRRLDTEGATTVVTTRGREDIGALLLPGLDDHAGPARRMPAGKTSAMVSAILDAALKEGPLAPPAEVAPVVVVRESVRRGPRRTLALLAAAVVIAAAVGAAAAVYVTKTLHPGTGSRTGKAAGHRVATGDEPTATAPAPADEQVEIEMEATTIRRPPARPDRPRPDRAAALPDDAPAEDVLALANLRRKDQDWRGADELYRRVMRSFPGTDAAVVAEVTSATIHLGHLGDPTGALKSYRHALATRPRGPLAEEARWGIAEAQRARGDRVAEYTALTEFLRAHPDSALRPAALRRQAELAELRRAEPPP